MMLGIITDPVFGPVVVVGLGGIYVEIMRDIAYRLPPIDRAEAKAMLRQLLAYPILEGARGKPPRDIDALCDVIVRVSCLAHDCRDLIQDVDINPIVVGAKGEGACIVDALIVPSASGSKGA
jgi:acyl-CoA synthetase (NDP forming)